MNSIILACPTLQYELQEARNAVDCQIPVRYIPQYLHDSPPDLLKYLQEVVDSITDKDRIYICVSSCGGGTAGLKATTAELVVPRTRDCIDILLSDKSLKELNRPMDGVFYTLGWADFYKNSSHCLEKLAAKHGQAYAEDYMRNLYDGFNKFYYIDTGRGDLERIHKIIDPLVECLYGTHEVIEGHYGILRKIVNEQIDDDFMVVPIGGCVDTSQFLGFY